jgi:hypothetical protein
MSRRVTYTVRFDVDDDVTDDEIAAMLGAAYAQIEDARVTLDDGVEREVPIVGSIVETTDVQHVDEVTG